MSQLSPEIAPQVFAACEASAEEASSALSRALDDSYELTALDPASLNLSELPEFLEGPGLALVFQFGDDAMLALLHESQQMLPDWYAEPDVTGQSKLATLAQELSMLLVPEDLMADDFRAGKVENLAAVLSQSGVSDGAAYIPLDLKVSKGRGTLALIWNAPQPQAIEWAAAGASQPAAAPEPAAAAPQPEPTPQDDFSRLPPYARTLLQIQVPMIVNLAAKKQSVGEITRLGPGSIIQFNKPCDESLTLQVGDLAIAEGEAVKVGENFGIRISSMLLPEERFRAVTAG